MAIIVLHTQYVDIILLLIRLTVDKSHILSMFTPDTALPMLTIHELY